MSLTDSVLTIPLTAFKPSGKIPQKAFAVSLPSFLFSHHVFFLPYDDHEPPPHSLQYSPQNGGYSNWPVFLDAQLFLPYNPPIKIKLREADLYLTRFDDVNHL